MNHVPTFTQAINHKKGKNVNAINYRHKNEHKVKTSKPFFEDQKPIDRKYYSSHETYELDPEIAQDLESFLK